MMCIFCITCTVEFKGGTDIISGAVFICRWFLDSNAPHCPTGSTAVCRLPLRMTLMVMYYSFFAQYDGTGLSMKSNENRLSNSPHTKNCKK